jgi:glycosyltransferase involved in cell wall biosynthesis
MVPELTPDPPADTAADERPRMYILLSAYACEPNQGSEPGIGWHWAVELARAGHEVWVLTRANNREAIESALDEQPLRNLHFMYYDLPAWARWWKRGSRGVRLYYLLWQWGAYRAVRHFYREMQFDIVHHITFGVFRHPSFMAFLRAPFIFGPVGGGETAPLQLRKTFPLRGYLLDWTRDLANWVTHIDPLMTAVYRRSAVILCKTQETLQRIPARYHFKCVVQPEVGIDVSALASHHSTRHDDGHFRVLYVGRLVYWKGLHLGLMAFAKLRETHAAQLTVIGSGPDENWLRDLAQRLGISDSVTWIAWMEHQAVLKTYPRYDAFLFPSLHDSSGNSVLEALSNGLPVVCLDLGGPAALVDPSCGFRVLPAEPELVVTRLAHALAALVENKALAHGMQKAAVQRVYDHFLWRQQVARMERVYMRAHLALRPDADLRSGAGHMQ